MFIKLFELTFIQFVKQNNQKVCKCKVLRIYFINEVTLTFSIIFDTRNLMRSLSVSKYLNISLRMTARLGQVLENI